ncbi:4-hydroxy-tetrahydrodipicolinate synthase [Aestuariispira insulae]|uniref:4-hydroxy-tetrahydrodipicolinate synthase n=1 Tax=Aestuariispira insulae TaxID=1461337 RepID=A0A3D9HWA6_9PROT|nr:4-hydroxy-tetrahydrodipicolinate synthase [Aestuariispira insulae]RED53778.1 4-hydroxy-tetrahydrodipicolinate synthase [Aestuariispira insulae]
MTAIFTGTYTAIVTPFTADLSVDWKAFAGLIKRQVKAGVDGVVVLGTTGEAPTVQGREYVELLSFAVQEAAGEIAVIAGVGGNDTQRTIEQARQAAATGVDGLLVTCPYYNKPTQNGIAGHYLAVAEAVDLPQIIYNIAGRTGVNIQTQTIVALSEHPNIVAVKEASENVEQIMDVISQTPDDFSVLSGSDSLTYSLVALGGNGAIATISNLVPEGVKEMIDAGLRGDKAASLAAHYRLLPLARTCFVESNPIPVKTALAEMGLLIESFRPPMCAMEPDNREVLFRCLRQQGLLAGEVEPLAAE